jgi:hypothetical protein
MLKLNGKKNENHDAAGGKRKKNEARRKFIFP